MKNTHNDRYAVGVDTRVSIGPNSASTFAAEFLTTHHRRKAPKINSTTGKMRYATGI